MSKGLSRLQRTILAELDRKPLSFSDVAEIHWNHRMKGRADKESLAGLRALTMNAGIKPSNYSAIYRTMRILVRR